MTAPVQVLLVEDSAADVRLVQEELRDADAGALVLVRAPTLGAARERLADEPVDCVLLDLSLPDAQGLEALAGVRAAAPDAPVVVLTGMPHDALALRRSTPARRTT